MKMVTREKHKRRKIFSRKPTKYDAQHPAHPDRPTGLARAHHRQQRFAAATMNESAFRTWSRLKC